jgi:hypothetical protein
MAMALHAASSCASLQRRSQPVRKTRFRLLAGLAVFALAMLAAGPAMANPEISSPPANFTPPLVNNACCGFVQITSDPNPNVTPVTGWMSGENVNLMICDGTPSTAPGWNPNSNCDSGTAPAAQVAGAPGNPCPTTTTCSVTWPANAARGLTFFDGPNPSGTFDCLYPTEPDPPDGFPHWGNNGRAPCQIIVTSNLGAPTGDQVLESFILPTPGAPVPETHYAIFLPLASLALLAGGYGVFRIRRRHSAGVAA